MMDLSFWLFEYFVYFRYYPSFNPCYDGFVILTTKIVMSSDADDRFNPCYDGFVILTCL